MFERKKVQLLERNKEKTKMQDEIKMDEERFPFYRLLLIYYFT